MYIDKYIYVQRATRQDIWIVYAAKRSGCFFATRYVERKTIFQNDKKITRAIFLSCSVICILYIDTYFVLFTVWQWSKRSLQREDFAINCFSINLYIQSIIYTYYFDMIICCTVSRTAKQCIYYIYLDNGYNKFRVYTLHTRPGEFWIDVDRVFG